MSTLSRRHFLAGASLAFGAATLGSRFASSAEPNRPRTAADPVTLGKTGIKTSLLGIGTGMTGGGHSSNQLRAGQAAFTRLIRHALDRGIRYIDSADMYGTHIFIREALKGVDRSNLFIQTKTRATHPEVAKADIDRYREELGMERLDTVLMHCMTKGSFPVDMRPVMDALQDAKEKGKIRAVGVSCHGWDPLEASVGCDWIDVQLARINPHGTAMDATPEKVAAQLKKMHDKGRGVIGMKICGGGGNTGAQDRLKSLRFVVGLGSVDCFAVGFETPQQIDEVVAQIESIGKEA